MVVIQRTPYKSIEVLTKNEEMIIISEGQKVKFTVENDGEVKKGTIVGFKGTKPENIEIEIIPIGKGHKEIWAVKNMVEGSLELIN